MAFYGVKMLDDLHHYPPTGSGTFSPVPVFVDTGTTLIDETNLDAFAKSAQ
jgi:ribose transport system substrate-binding protein